MKVKIMLSDTVERIVESFCFVFSALFLGRVTFCNIPLAASRKSFSRVWGPLVGRNPVALEDCPIILEVLV